MSQARINWEGCNKKGIWRKNRDAGGGSLISPDGVAPSRIVGVSASVIFPCTIKPRRRWRAKIRLLCITPWVPTHAYTKRRWGNPVSLDDLRADKLIGTWCVEMEEADEGWLMIRTGEWVNVSSGTGSPE